jgi:hypothetical protein
MTDNLFFVKKNHTSKVHERVPGEPFITRLQNYYIPSRQGGDYSMPELFAGGWLATSPRSGRLHNCRQRLDEPADRTTKPAYFWANRWNLKNAIFQPF